jgi:hypothetical protein
VLQLLLALGIKWEVVSIWYTGSFKAHLKF